VYGILRQVHEWGVLRDIGAYIRVEKGAMVREARHWGEVADRCSAAIQCGFGLFEGLAFLVRRVVDGTWQFVGVPEVPTSYEKLLLLDLQRWLDAVRDSPELLHGAMCDAIAGFGGCDVQGLRRFGASSGVEAALHLSWSVRHAIARQSEHPFLWMGLVEGQGRRATPVRGRSCPDSPAETDSDDRSILLAVANGESSSKGIANQSAQFGRAVKDGHVRKRKHDLVRWGLVDGRSRPWRLTTQGVEWVRAMQRDSVPTKTTT